MENYFAHKSYNFGEANATDKISYKFQLLPAITPEEVHYITVACGSCTTSFYDPESHTINGTLDLEKGGAKGKDSLIKTITVYFDPDQPEFIADANYQRVTNRNKRRQSLSISGKIKKD